MHVSTLSFTEADSVLIKYPVGCSRDAQDLAQNLLDQFNVRGVFLMPENFDVSVLTDDQRSALIHDLMEPADAVPS